MSFKVGVRIGSGLGSGLGLGSGSLDGLYIVPMKVLTQIEKDVCGGYKRRCAGLTSEGWVLWLRSGSAGALLYEALAY